MLLKRLILLSIICLFSLTMAKAQKTKKKAIVKLEFSGFTITAALKGDSVKYYAVILANVVKFMDEDDFNYSMIKCQTKEDVIVWLDEAINASHTLKENPDEIVYGEKTFYKFKSGNTLISTNNNPEEYFKCTDLILERAKKIFLKKTK